MQVTLNLPDDLATQLSLMEHKLPQILELGLRELDASTQSGFSGAADVLEFLASLPTPEEIIALRPSTALQTQIRACFKTITTAAYSGFLFLLLPCIYIVEVMNITNLAVNDYVYT